MSAPPTNSALYQKLRGIERGDRGLCARCPARAAEDRSMCERCLEKSRVRRRKGTPPGRKLLPRGDRWAEMFREGMTPGQIARVEGVSTSLVCDALKARKLWQRRPRGTVKP